MAKGSRLGVMRGKIGNEVLYKITNSNNNEQQGTRVYQANVTNPRTERQAAQRMKMTPAVNMYRALGQILDHSFQGVKYGGRSHSEFMKRAMNLQTGYPYVSKGNLTPYPGKYTISTGSLPPISVDFEASGMIIKGSSVNGSQIPNTVGEISNLILNSIPGVAIGDQLTFVFAQVGGISSVANFTPDMAIYWHIGRFVVNPDNTATRLAWETSQGMNISLSSNKIFVSSQLSFANGSVLLAAACILSRPPKNEGGTWQRSTTELLLADGYENVMMSITAYQQALESYQNTEKIISSDWYLNNGNGDPTTNAAGSAATISGGQVTINGSSFLGAFFTNRGTKLIVGPIDGGSRVVYKYINANTIRNAGTYTTAEITAAGISSVTLVTTVQNYLPSLEVQETEPDDERP